MTIPARYRCHVPAELPHCTVPFAMIRSSNRATGLGHVSRPQFNAGRVALENGRHEQAHERLSEAVRLRPEW